MCGSKQQAAMRGGCLRLRIFSRLPPLPAIHRDILDLQRWGQHTIAMAVGLSACRSRDVVTIFDSSRRINREWLFFLIVIQVRAFGYFGYWSKLWR